MGGLKVAVDWGNTTGNGEDISGDALEKSGVLDLAAAVARVGGGMRLRLRPDARRI